MNSDRILPTTRVTEQGIRLAILSVFVEGARRRDPGAVVNALVSLAATYLPDVVERLYPVAFHPWQRVYTASAMLMHAVGMLGPYDDVWWWDHLTHTLSATLFGGILYVTARRRGRDPRPRVIGGIVGVGGLWELLEYGIHVVSRRVGLEPVLVSYGRRDTALDLAFNLVGAILTLAFGDHLLANFFQRDE